MSPENMAKLLSPDPTTIVDRLNGIYDYPTVTNYGAIRPVTNAVPTRLNVEAANEILRLRWILDQNGIEHM